MGANRATRSSRRPLLGACVRRDQEGRTEGFGDPSAPSTQNLFRDVSGLETSRKKARAWPSKLPPQGYTHRQG